MEFDLDGSNSYRVEVSGWDAKENFFVEKTTLAWHAEAHREVTLQSPVRRGAVVFVRLLRPLSNDNDFPIAYEAVKIAGKDGEGRTRVHLMRLHPNEMAKRQSTVPGTRSVN